MSEKCGNCGKGILESDRRVCTHCGFSACKSCVRISMCPKCKYSGAMKKP